MTNYVKSTNFATKDALASGNPLKIVKGAEIDTEFNNIATAVATKADLNSPTLVTPALGTPSSGTLTNCTSLPIDGGTTGTLPVARGGTGVTTSTGSGNNVLSTSPTLVTPILGTPTSGTLSNCTSLPIDGGTTGTLPVARGGTGVTTSTGSGNVVLSTSPTLVTPILGTPTSGTLTNCTGLPMTTGVTGTLPVANGGTGVTTSTGSGSTVLSNTPTIASPTFTGTPAAPTASSGTNTTQLATTAFVQTALQAIYPVGSVYINATNATNPGTLLGFGTWAAFGAGRVPVGFNASDPLFDTAEETGGSADAVVVSHTHTATVTDPGHSHGLPIQNDYGYPVGSGGARQGTGTTTDSATTGISVAISTAGSSGTNANYQPYITVYMWKRTA